MATVVQSGTSTAHPSGDVSEMCSYAMDAWFDDISVLTEPDTLLAAMRDAAAAGQAQVVGQASHIFPNGAVTAVLLLSESHLCVHTWPEHRLASFDLLTCGALNADLMVSHLAAALSPARTKTVRTVRDLR